MPVFADNRPLLDAFRRGERSALESVYRHYFDEIVAIARHGFVLGAARVSGMRDADDQLDVAQDVFIKAFKESARLAFDGIRPYGPFVRRIARNAMIDRARKSGREIPTELDDETLEAPSADGESTVEEDLDFKRMREETEAYLLEQDDELQQFVRLRFVEGMSQYEVLKKMQVTRRRVRTLEQRAMDGLRKHLKKKGLSWD